MKKIFYLIRHGETEMNVKNIFRGRLEIPLNENGKNQIKSLGEVLKNKGIEIIYSSPLKRSIMSAEILSKSIGRDFYSMEEFNNINLGIWQGMEKEMVKEKFPKEWERWINDTDNFKIEGGETLKDIRDRIDTGFKKLLKKKEKKIAIVTHRSILKVIFAYILQIEKNYFWKFYFDNGSYSILKHSEERGFQVRGLNINTHLSHITKENF